MMSGNELLGSIPMPPGGASNDSPSTSDAWRKAAAALQKVQHQQPPAQSTPAQASVTDVQAAMLQYYPWMAQYGVNMPFQPPPTSMYSYTQVPYSYSTAPVMHRPIPPRPSIPPRPVLPPRPTLVRPAGVSFRLRAPQPQRFATISSASGSAQRGNADHSTSVLNLDGEKKAIPDTVQKWVVSEETCNIFRKYVERAYMAVDNEDDKNKVEKYLKEKLKPLLDSGAAWTVNWEKEPLPSEVNFVLKAAWVPASELKKSSLAPGVRRGRYGRRLPRSPSPPPPPPVVPKVEAVQPAKPRYLQASPQTPPMKKRNEKRSPSVLSIASSSSDHGDRLPSIATKPAKKKVEKKKGKKKQRWEAPDDVAAGWKRNERARRFAARAAAPRRARLLIDKSPAAICDFSHLNIVGTCEDVEKPFFRLTAAPDPAQVRPPKILQVALEVVKHQYATVGDYRYANDQLKSIRQDLMIQCVRSDFTVAVYETHARIALEKRDREEFNQCQSQLKLLYAEIPNCDNRNEFTAYRLLYYIYMENTLDQITLLNELSSEARNDVCVSFALKVRAAWALCQASRLFALYAQAPKMTSYVMDWFIERERRRALTTVLKSYRPNVPISFLASLLRLSKADLENWLRECGIEVVDEAVDCRLYANTRLATAS